jgi:hypothetical protein
VRFTPLLDWEATNLAPSAASGTAADDPNGIRAVVPNAIDLIEVLLQMSEVAFLLQAFRDLLGATRVADTKEVVVPWMPIGVAHPGYLDRKCATGVGPTVADLSATGFVLSSASAAATNSVLPAHSVISGPVLYHR